MKVAMIGDVHANLHALEAVLADIDRCGAEAIWNVGDFVGYGAHPDQVVGVLRRRATVSILGNYDRKVLAFPDKKDKWLGSKNAKKVRAFEYAWEHLSEESRRHLASLPGEARISVGGRSVLLVHGSCEADDEPLTDETDESRLMELAGLCDADVVVCGHTHRAMCREAGGVLFVNTGSVGRPAGTDRRACYAMMAIDAGRVEVEHRRVAYDLDGAVAAIRRGGQPEVFAQMVLTGDGFFQAERTIERSRRATAVAAAEALARRMDVDPSHAEQVTRLALELFDKMADLHGLGDEERFILHCAAAMHDIGWSRGAKGHHKASMRLILADETVPLDDRRRKLVACVARYHRKAAPKDKHACYGELEEADRGVVWMLAGILRVADGLDYSHGSVVRDLEVRAGGAALEIVCRGFSGAQCELAQARKKSDVLARATGRQVVLEAERVRA